MTNDVVRDLCSKISTPNAVVSYDQIIQSSFAPETIMTQPLIGFKVCLYDTSNMFPRDRILQLEQYLCPMLVGTGCFLRETGINSMNGFQLVSLPVPKNWRRQQLKTIEGVLAFMKANFGIIPTNGFEVSVSGRCNPFETEMKLSQIEIPSRYIPFMKAIPESPYRVGAVRRINEGYILVTTKWIFPENTTIPQAFESISEIAQVMASIY